jgi:hypothetical protein
VKLSEHFSLAELHASQTATRRGIDNTPPPAARAELRRLVGLILQPLRTDLQRPIVVSSGYRSPVLNERIGGAAKSAHVQGRAADISVPGMPITDVCRRIAALRLPYRQLIHEGTWVHVEVSQAGTAPKREHLTANFTAGRATYTRGIDGVPQAPD